MEATVGDIRVGDVIEFRHRPSGSMIDGRVDSIGAYIHMQDNGGWLRSNITELVIKSTTRSGAMSEGNEINTTEDLILEFTRIVMNHGGCSEGRKKVLDALFGPPYFISTVDTVEDSRPYLRENLMRVAADTEDFGVEGIDRLMVKLGGSPVPKPDVTVTFPRELFDALTKQVGTESVSWGGYVNGLGMGRQVYEILDAAQQGLDR